MDSITINDNVGDVIHVLFVAGRDNSIRKLTGEPGGKVCLHEILHPLTSNDDNDILNLKFHKETVSF